MILDAGVELVLTTSALASKADTLAGAVPELASSTWLDVEGVEISATNPAFEDAPRPGEVAFLQYTSGSTSAPRGVVVTHANLLHNLAGSAQLGLHDSSSVSVSWLPVNHDMGLIQGVLQPVFSGFPGCLMSPVAFLQRPARWLKAISKLGATHSGGPNFAYDLCVRRVSDLDRRQLDLSSWKVAFSGSEPVRRSTLDAFERTFSSTGFRRHAFRPAYGLAESTLLVTSTQPDQRPTTLTLDRAALRQGRVLLSTDTSGSPIVGCGSPHKTVRVEIVNPATGVRCAPDEIGEIWISGGSVADGYWRRPEQTASVFSARLADTGDGPFLRSGDLGFLHGGELFITGRIKDVMIVRGLKHDPHDVELTVEGSEPAIRPGCVAAFTLDAESDAVGIAAEVEIRDADPNSLSALIETIRGAVAVAHGIQLSTVLLLPPATLPKTTSGKIQRYACREAVSSGSFTPIARWDAVEAAWPLERTA
jgi:acyl-CoA synthetase (AMP-forming)/AMP-acid ligase II